MTSLVLELSKLYPRLKNAFKKFEDTGNMTVSSCKARMSHLEKVWSSYEQNNMSLIAHKGYESLQTQPYFKDDHFSSVEEMYIMNMCRFQAFLDENTTNENNDRPLPRPQIVTLDNERLLPLQIPHFSGEYTAWESFRDIFQSSVINKKNYSNVSKLHQLISVLEGDAATIAASYQPTDANFEIVWNKLKERYEVKKRLVHAHIANVYSLKPILKPSASELKKILSGVNTPLSALKGLGRAVDSWNDLIVFHILNLLDNDSRKQWEIYYNTYCNSLPPPETDETDNATVIVKASSEPPSLAKLLEFIENQISILESIEEASSSHTSKQCLDFNKNKSANNSNNSAKVFSTSANNQNKSSQNLNNNCIICNANHFFLFCADYKNKTPKQREEIVSKHKRCFNCLGAHFISNCSSTKRCTICKQKHHTSLHIKGFKKNTKNTNTDTNNATRSTNTEVAITDTSTLSTNS